MWYKYRNRRQLLGHIQVPVHILVPVDTSTRTDYDQPGHRCQHLKDVALRQTKMQFSQIQDVQGQAKAPNMT